VVVGELIGSEGGGGDIGRRCDCVLRSQREKYEGKRFVVERGTVL